MLIVEGTVKGAKTFARNMTKERKRHGKALNVAIRSEGYHQWLMLKKEIRAGSPGGHRLRTLTYLARIKGSGRLKPNKPMRRLAGAARYKVSYGGDFEFRFGWDTHGVSSTLKKIAKRSQEGYTINITPAMRRRFIRIAAKLGKRSKTRKYLFLRKSTVSAEVPAREMMEPYWAAHVNEARKNIKSKFRRRLKGEFV